MRKHQNQAGLPYLPCTPTPWEARAGDVLNPDRTWGVVRPLTREQCIEIDGNASEFGKRTEVIAEVCLAVTDENDAKLMAVGPEAVDVCHDLVNFSDDLGSPAWNGILRKAREVLGRVGIQ